MRARRSGAPRGSSRAVRAAYPDLVISTDTWRHEVAREACAAGADLINDSWGGWDDKLAEVAAEVGARPWCARTLAGRRRGQGRTGLATPTWSRT